MHDFGFVFCDVETGNLKIQPVGVGLNCYSKKAEVCNINNKKWHYCQVKLITSPIKNLILVPNVKLSAAELALACNADVLLTKNSVIDKVYSVFGQLAKTFAEAANLAALPAEVLKPSAKISKGENYMGLPWVMLDYPRYFSGNNIFSIRTMFWWGNYFSQFILLKGDCIPAGAAKKITGQFKEECFLCTTSDPWQHHFDTGNMISTKSLATAQIDEQIHRCGFFKLATKIPIEKWESVEIFMNENFKKLLEISGGN